MATNGGKTTASGAAGGGKARAGQLDADSVEVWSDEDHARATGLLSILREDGTADAARVPPLSPDELRRLYAGMLLSRKLDDRLMPMQRQGRIGFYIECRGQEAGMIGGAHALAPGDWFVQGLRETAAALYRGLPLRAHIAQIFGNANDLAQGHQLPCHSGSRATNHLIMSSCVSSQMPQAAGIAWAAKLSGTKDVALCYCGDGGTSEEDFHVALNFAAAFALPVVFVCQNNQWAISTPLALQTASETIAQKGLAYGVPSVRVDGNDVLACYAAVKEAVERARAGGGPGFVECVTYRVGPHSSSDDPTRYRAGGEPAEWTRRDPLARFKLWLAATGALPTEAEAALSAALDAQIRNAIAAEENVGAPAVETLVANVYARPTWLQAEQLADLRRVRGR